MSDRKNLIKLYGQYSLKLAALVKEGERLSMDEQIFIENHLLIVQLAITGKKYGGTQKTGSVKI